MHNKHPAMKEQNIEKLFKDTFSNFEADVNPSAWANIEQNLPASPQNVPGKPSGFFGKMYLSTIALVVVISAALIGTVAYLSSEKSVSKDVVVQNAQTQSQPSQVVATPSDAPGNNPATEIKNTAAEKRMSNKEVEEVIATLPSLKPSAAPVEKKTETNSVTVSPDGNPS